MYGFVYSFGQSEIRKLLVDGFVLGDSGGVVNSLLLLLVHTFFTMEGGDREFANFTLPTLKAFLEASGHNLSGNKQ